jgi:hypothetical protein
VFIKITIELLPLSAIIALRQQLPSKDLSRKDLHSNDQSDHNNGEQYEQENQGTGWPAGTA